MMMKSQKSPIMGGKSASLNGKFGLNKNLKFLGSKKIGFVGWKLIIYGKRQSGDG
jgi:hypothetical protein